MSRLIIAEKKSSGESVAAYLSKTSGIPARPFKSHIIVGEDTIAWLRGHVLKLVNPEIYNPAFSDRSNFNQLPIIPETFQLEVGESTAGYVSNIKSLIKESDSICHFGDPDREGQLIVDELLDYLGNRKVVTRLWTSSLNDFGLAKAFSEISPNEKFSGYFYSALARRDADWLYGINMSRAVTIAAKKRGSTGYFTVGRVQTPTLALVVNREKEITGFIKVDHFKPWIDIASSPGFRANVVFHDLDDRLSSDGLLINKDIADNIVKLSKQMNSAEVTDFSTIPRSDNQPLPFSLSALQGHCSALFGYSGAKTLEIAQSLYLLKIICYPRASCDYYPEDQFLEAPTIITSLARAALPSSFSGALRGVKLSIKSRGWNDKEQEDHGHHAIAPVILDNPGVVSTLTEDQKKIYFEIVKRYILQFWQPSQFLETTIKLSTAGENYEAVGRKIVDEGWKKAFSHKDVDDDSDLSMELNVKGPKSKLVILPTLTVGQIVQLSGTGYESIETKPPKRFTEGSLLTAMKNIHRFVLDPVAKAKLKTKAGIGTEATRAETIKVLLERELILLNGSDLYPSEKGAKLISALPIKMTSPDMTAVWESFMDDLLAGKGSYSDFIKEQKNWLKDLVKLSVDFFEGVIFSPEPGQIDVKETTHPCFDCSTLLRLINGKNGKFFGCPNVNCKKTYNEKDGLPVNRVILNDSGIGCPDCKKNSLVRRSRSDKSGFFWSCNGWRSDKKGCNALFSDDNGAPNFEKKTPSKSTEIKTFKTTGISCPDCKEGHLFRVTKKAPSNGFYWSCSRWKDGCTYKTDDQSGLPNLKKVSTQKPVAALEHSSKPSLTNRFIESVSGRGTFAGRGK